VPVAVRKLGRRKPKDEVLAGLSQSGSYDSAGSNFRVARENQAARKRVQYDSGRSLARNRNDRPSNRKAGD